MHALSGIANARAQRTCEEPKQLPGLNQSQTAFSTSTFSFFTSISLCVLLLQVHQRTPYIPPYVVHCVSVRQQLVITFSKTKYVRSIISLGLLYGFVVRNVLYIHSERIMRAALSAHLCNAGPRSSRGFYCTAHTHTHILWPRRGTSRAKHVCLYLCIEHHAHAPFFSSFLFLVSLSRSLCLSFRVALCPVNRFNFFRVYMRRSGRS